MASLMKKQANIPIIPVMIEPAMSSPDPVMSPYATPEHIRSPVNTNITVIIVLLLIPFLSEVDDVDVAGGVRENDVAEPLLQAAVLVDVPEAVEGLRSPVEEEVRQTLHAPVFGAALVVSLGGRRIHDAARRVVGHIDVRRRHGPVPVAQVGLRRLVVPVPADVRDPTVARDPQAAHLDQLVIDELVHEVTALEHRGEVDEVVIAPDRSEEHT